jgi:hypothetical protein
MTNTMRVLRREHERVHEEILLNPASLRAGDIILPKEEGVLPEKGLVLVAAKVAGIVSLIESQDGDPNIFTNHIYTGRNLQIGEKGEPTPIHSQEYFRVDYDGTEGDRQSYELMRAKLNAAKRTVQSWRQLS